MTEGRTSNPKIADLCFPFYEVLQAVSQRDTCPDGYPSAGRLLPFGPDNVSIRIRSITERPSLVPALYADTSNSVPCGFACSIT